MRSLTLELLATKQSHPSRTLPGVFCQSAIATPRQIRIILRGPQTPQAPTNTYPESQARAVQNVRRSKLMHGSMTSVDSALHQGRL